MIFRKKEKEPRAEPRYPGVLRATDGSEAVVEVETAASEAAGAYPITPSTQMGEGWAVAVASGKTNVNGRRLIFFEPEGEHAAAAVTAGMSMTGLRATNFSSGQGIAYMHESLYAAAGKRLTYVLNVAARAMTKHALNVHAGHDDYHAVDDTGFFQMFAKDVQEVADLTVIAHRIAEMALNPGLVAQDGFLTSHVIESIRAPERELIAEYLGDPSDTIDSPTPAQRMVFGETRRRIPEMFDYDYPAMLGIVQNQESYAQGVAAQRPFYFDHVADLTDRAMAEWAELTGRAYARASGYRLEDAEWVLAGQGSVVANAEAVADFLRETAGLKVGVLNLTMFRPFPADLVAALLAGKRGVTVLERVDQPLAVDAPLLREIRSAMAQAVENGRASDPELPYPSLPELDSDEVPDFYSAGFGFGSRDLQPGDLVAAVDNMLEEGSKRRRYYLGVDFVRKDTKLPKLQLWQEELLEAYPDIERLALPTAGDLDLNPDGSIALRIHSVGGWGAITTGKNLVMTAFGLAGMHVKANPKYGSEKKGQPTTFYATLAHEPIRTNCELKHVDVVLSPDPNVFRHSDPLAGLSHGGTFVIQSDADPDAFWRSLPISARRDVIERELSVYVLDGFSIAAQEASDAELRYRMQGAAFMGAFFAASPFMEREEIDEETLFGGIEEQLEKKFGKRGRNVVEDNLRVIRRGFAEVRKVETGETAEIATDAEPTEAPAGKIPGLMQSPLALEGVGNPGRFFEQVCGVCAIGDDVIADPFTAISAMPAASSAIRDMTDIRFEVPDFVASKCTGCSQCWVQCPDAAIPGLVNTVEELFEAAIAVSSNGRTFDRLRGVVPHIAREARKVVKAVEFETFGDVATTAYHNVADKLGWDPDRRKQLDDEFAAVHSRLAEFPLAKTAPFWDVPEAKQKGSGGLLSITINPTACKGCNICVEVCPEDALVTVDQDEEIVERLERNWELWEALPDTDDRYVNVADLDEGIGVLSSLLLKKGAYRSMVGGDGACMGCGEKTTVHLVTSTVEALMQPRVAELVEKIDGLIARLDEKARDLLSADADLDLAAVAEGESVDVPLDEEKKATLARWVDAKKALEDLKWRYEEGPSGKGRANLGISNSTGCSSVWGSTFPYNPYPYPWVNHLFQDAPSIAIGIFEGHMRKMADAFIDVRRAELLADDAYDAEEHEAFFEAFDWEQFTDEEFLLCPPVMAIGGDGAMLDIGFQNLSRLMASGKPIRVVILDTQVYSNTGGQACTSGFTGQVADMSAYGAAQHGKEEVRKEIGLIAIAHRGVYVHQSSQASASHLIEGVIKGLNSRRPAVFNIYTPCPVEHGLADEWAPEAAKLALESRAFPYLTYDPDGGESIPDCLSLMGNPATDERWPEYTMDYVDEEGERASMTLPVTIADWAATEARFKKHFRPIPRDDWDDDAQVAFHEFVDLDDEEREGKTPFVWTLDDRRRRARVKCSAEMVELAEERLAFWSQLRQLAGIEVSEAVRDAVADRMEPEFEARAAQLRDEYEKKLADLRATYPRVVARRLAEGLIRSGNGERTVEDLLSEAEKTPGLKPISLDADELAALGGPAAEAPVEPTPAEPAGADAGPDSGVAVAPAPAEVEEEEEESDELVIEPYIETARCTTCNECTNLNGKMFKYDENKQAYIADAKAGTFRELVMAAEKCPADIIHPGTPLNPKEKDLDKWIERAKPYQ
ncbi:MAG: 2-oxoacid:acceptor oxidoreductase family protein [Gemmatimonadota bacterium]|nr:2-oxoacid:acceptor oxidoreductase family protein [Gemmatimonadota bacterium]